MIIEMEKYYDKHELLYKFLKNILAPLTLKVFLKKINNKENIKLDKPFIIASNHLSLLDPFILGAVFAANFNKKIYFIGNKELFRTFPTKIFHETVGTIPLDRANKEEALSTALNYLKEGKIVGIFPEGTRSLTGKLQRAKTGIARLALLSKAPVLPIAISGTFEVMPRGRVIPKLKKKVAISFGKLMHFERYHNKRISKDLLEKITGDIMLNIENLMRNG